MPDKIDSNKYLFEKVMEYRQKEKITEHTEKVISLDCALLGWHACIEWLESRGIDCHKAFDEE